MSRLKEEPESHSIIRSYELDWLRVVAVMMLVFYHSAMMFGIGWFHIKNPETSFVLNLLCRFLEIWHMPLFFLVAGASSWFALEFRTGRQYRLERTRRLIIPLLFGILLLASPISYFENIQTNQFSGSFIAYYPHFFNGIYPYGNLTWSHLWFVYYLFNFSLICSLLFVYLKSSKGQKHLRRFSNLFVGKRSVHWPALPIILIEITLRWRFSSFQTFFTDWANVFHYFLIFTYGFLLYSDARCMDVIIDRLKQVTWLAGLFTVAYLLVTHFSGYQFVGYHAKPGLLDMLNQPRLGGGYVLSMILKVLAEWSLLMAMVGFAKKHLSHRKEEIAPASRIAFPFYVFHHTIVIALGFYIVRLPVSAGIKFLIISLTAIPLVYICSVMAASNKVTRFMFGIK